MIPETRAKYFYAIAVAIIITIMATSCGPSYHLKQAKKHLALAGALGAKFQHDTTWKQVVVPSTTSDTTVEVNGILWDNDTTIVGQDGGSIDWIAGDGEFTIETVKWKAKTVIKRDTVTHKVVVYQQVECPEQKVSVPCDTSTEITVVGVKERALYALGGALLMLILMLVFGQARKSRGR